MLGRRKGRGSARRGGGQVRGVSRGASFGLGVLFDRFWICYLFYPSSPPDVRPASLTENTLFSSSSLNLSGTGGTTRAFGPCSLTRSSRLDSPARARQKGRRGREGERPRRAQGYVYLSPARRTPFPGPQGRSFRRPGPGRPARLLPLRGGCPFCSRWVP